MSDVYVGNPFVPVDTYVNRELARLPPLRVEREEVDCIQEEVVKPYKVRKVRADRAAIEAFDALPRPKKPPGR